VLADFLRGWHFPATSRQLSIMKRLPPTTFLFLLGTILLLGQQAHGVTVLTANVTHDQETGAPGTTPPTTSTGDPRPLSFGSGTFTLNDAQTELTFTVTIFNIDVNGSQTPDTFDNLAAAHIHAPAPAGANGGVVWGFFGAPDNDTAPDDLVVTPHPGGVGGVFTAKWDQAEGNAGTTLTAQLPAILGGLSYINFHTTQFPGGEIRGQIVPEPGSIALVAGGLLALLGARRRGARG
jgi:CHRD domain/PEP-CTERM motif